MYDVLDLRTITAPSGEPVSLAEARLQCKIDAEIVSPLPPHPDDDLIRTLIKAARQYVEKAVCMVVTDAVYQFRRGPLGFDARDTHFRGAYASSWLPSSVPLQLPYGNVDHVESVKYLDLNETEQTLDPATWYLNDNPWAPYVGLLKGKVWPPVYNRPDAWRVVFSGGPASPQPLEADLVLAMKLLVGHWYRNRENAVDQVLQEIPLGAKVLIQPYRRGMGV